MNPSSTSILGSCVVTCGWMEALPGYTCMYVYVCSQFQLLMFACMLAGSPRGCPRGRRVLADGASQKRAVRGGLLRAPDHPGAGLPHLHSQAGGTQGRHQRFGAGKNVLLLLLREARRLRQEETRPIAPGAVSYLVPKSTECYRDVNLILCLSVSYSGRWHWDP